MADDKPSPDELERRRRWFEGYTSDLAGSVVEEPAPDRRHGCPCCGFLTLDGRGQFAICPVCFWEDDGQDDHDAGVVRGGPNGGLSLAQARSNFASIGASDERWCAMVRPPTPEERGELG